MSFKAGDIHLICWAWTERLNIQLDVLDEYVLWGKYLRGKLQCRVANKWLFKMYDGLEAQLRAKALVKLDKLT